MLDQEYNQYGQKARAFFKKVAPRPMTRTGSLTSHTRTNTRTNTNTCTSTCTRTHARTHKRLHLVQEARHLDLELGPHTVPEPLSPPQAGLMTKGESKWASSMQTGAEKAPVQMLADKPAGYRPSVWTQIGAQDPAQNARQVAIDALLMPGTATRALEKRRLALWIRFVQEAVMLIRRVSSCTEPSSEPTRLQVMKQNEDFGYKAPVQMLSQKHNPYPSVWRQIGSTEPSQQAQSVMSQSDNFGYKAAPQVDPTSASLS